MDFDNAYQQMKNQFEAMAYNATIKDRAIEIDDLVQEGALILLKCMERYPWLQDSELRKMVSTSFGNLLKDYYKKKFLDADDIDEPGNEPWSDEWVQEYMASVFLKELDSALCQFDRAVLNELIGINTQSALRAHKRSKGLPDCKIQTMDVAAVLKVPYWKTMRSVRRIKETYKHMRGSIP